MKLNIFQPCIKQQLQQQNIFFFSFTNFGRDRVKDTNSDGPDSVCNNERFFSV